MKIKSMLLVAGIVAAMAPVGAQASHCANPIYVFARHSVPGGPYPDPRGGNITYAPTAVSSAAGCTVQDPAIPHEATETDVIYPGADTLQVRLLRNSDPSSVVSATLTFAGVTYDLVMKNTTTITGANATFLDSQNIAIDPATTFAGNEAVVEICTVDEDECFTRTYRTVA
jgi:hypothetical protein